MANQRPKGWWYPYIFVGGFLVVLAVNITLMFFATTSFNGLETRHAWEEGNSYNAQIAAEDRQKALGWTVQFDSEPAPGAVADGGGTPARLELTVQDKDGNPVDGLTVNAMVRRPTQEGYDRTVQLAPFGPGTYRQVVGLPMIGQWEVRLVASRGEDAYKLRERFTVQ